MKGIHRSDPGCLPSYRDTPGFRLGEDRRGASWLETSSVVEAPFRPFVHAGTLRHQAGASSQARAQPLDPPCGSPEATSTMHLTDDCCSLFFNEHPCLVDSRPLTTVTRCGAQGARRFTPPSSLRRVDRQGDEHFAPIRHSSATEPLTPLSSAPLALRDPKTQESSKDRPRPALPRTP